MSSSALKLQQQLIEDASALVSKLTGIQLGEKQSAMVQARLSKRMLELRMTSEQYYDYLRTHADQESQVLVSLLTTHHTFFFREFAHFEFLSQTGLKKLTDAIRAQGRKTLRIWSTACSGGHEVYSLSMLLAAHLKDVAPDFNYEIMGSDVDPESVAIAKNGVYKWDEVKGAPSAYLGTHWVRGTGDIAAFVKAKKSIKDPCRFDVKNLTELHREPSPAKYDVVFCRNVLIYFTQEQIKQISKELLRRLEPHGYLFLGISESLMGLDVPVNYAGPSIYVHKANLEVVPKDTRKQAPVPTAVSKAPAATPSLSVVPPAPADRPIRLLCVDDSPVVLSLLKKIFSTEPGFEVVATAKTGLEAAEMLKKHQVDAMTLDIHMPEQNGLEYLQKNFGAKHPPVVMVTSVSREDSQLGVKCLESGARDFVEKPGLNNLEEKGEELRMKIRCAVRSGLSSNAGMMEVSRSFSRPGSIQNPEKKLRVIVCGLSDRERLFSMMREIMSGDPATLVLLHGGEAMMESLLPKLKIGGGTAKIWDGTTKFTSGLYVADLSRHAQTAAQQFAGRKTSIMVIGDVTKQFNGKISDWVVQGGANLIVEEGAGYSKAHADLRSVASSIMPMTSFVHTADTYLSKEP